MTTPRPRSRQPKQLDAGILQAEITSFAPAPGRRGQGRQDDPDLHRGGATVLVHGDLWQGNTLWSADVCTGVIDWDAAGAGPPGIDLGTLRLDAALDHGPGAAGQILHGWREAAGREPEHVAYWDIVAALTTVGDMARCMPPLLDHHRPDLDARTLTARRDAFLSTALNQLDS